MKILYFLLLSLFIPTHTNGQSGEMASNSKKKSKVLVMTPMTNPQTGELMGHIPLPKKWKIEGGIIIGPNGVKTADYPFNYFDFQQRMVISLEEVVRQDIAPVLSKAGGKVLGTFVIPELQNYDRAYNELLWKFGNPRNEFYALGIDCESPDGIRTLLLLRLMVS